MKTESRRKNNSVLLLLKLHKYLGLMVFLVLLWLAVSGIALNHTSEFQLSKYTVNNATVKSLYGIPDLQIDRAVKLPRAWLLEVDQRFYFGEKTLSTLDYQPLVGAIQTPELLFVARTNSLLIYTHEGDFVDNLPVSDVVKAMDVLDGNLVLKTASACLSSNQSYTEFHTCSSQIRPFWQGLDVVLPNVQADFLRKYQDNGVSLEQVILDAHSGRLFGNAGVYFMDAIAVLIIVLSLSGFSLWLIRKYRRLLR